MKKYIFALIFTLIVTLSIAQVKHNHYYELGEDAYMEGNYKEAIEYFNQALIVDPCYFKALCDKAFCLMLINKMKESIENYNYALRNCTLDNDEKAELYWKRSMTYSQNNYLEEAIRDCDSAINYGYPYIYPYFDKFSYLFQLKKEKEANDYFKIIISKFSDYPSFISYAYKSLGQLLYQRSRFNEAIYSYSVAIDYQNQKDTSNIKWISYVRAESYFQIGEYTKALADINHYIATVSNADHALMKRVYIYNKMGKSDEVSNDLQSIINLGKNNDITAKALMLTGKKDEAFKIANELYNKHITEADISEDKLYDGLILYAHLYSLSGDVKESVKYLDLYLKYYQKAFPRNILSNDLYFIFLHPELENVRNDKLFKDLLNKYKITQQK